MNQWYQKIIVLVVCSLIYNALLAPPATPRSPIPGKPQSEEELSKKMLSKLSFEDLKKRKNELIASGSKEIAIKYLQKMIGLVNTVEEISELMLELADIYFDLGTLEKSQLLYEEFARLYPGNEYAEYAAYKSILCGFYGMLEIDRDQTKTKETIKQSELFLAKSTRFKEYSGEVKKILTTCEEHLFNSELKVARFYASQFRNEAAKVRIANIEKEFTGKIPNLKPRLLLAEVEFATWQGDKKAAEQKATELAQNFPDFEIPAKTKSRITKPEKPSLTIAKNGNRNFANVF